MSRPKIEREVGGTRCGWDPPVVGLGQRVDRRAGLAGALAVFGLDRVDAHHLFQIVALVLAPNSASIVRGVPGLASGMRYSKDSPLALSV
jgi:hypothetical protein